MIRWLGSFLFVLCCVQASAIEAVVSRTVFYSHEKGQIQPYVELSWQINPSSIHFAQTDSKQWQARIKTDIVFSNEKGVLREEHFVLQTSPAPDYEQAVRQSIIDLRRYSLPTGKVRLTVTLTETIFPDKHFSYADSFIIAPPVTGPYYSDLQLLDTSFNSTTQNVFQKNGRVQIPLNGNFLNDNRGTVHFYTELYNAQATDTAQQLLAQRVFISKRPLDPPILKLYHIDTLKPQKILPFIGQFNIASLPSGNYYLNAVLENGSKDILASQSLFFQRSNKNPVAVTKDTLADTGMERVNILDLSNTFIGKYSFGQVKAILKMMLPIASTAEARSINNFLDRPEDTYMRYFIYNFWKARNEKDPKKPWDEYTTQVKEVNKLFGYGSLPGYETERGILYLKYGKPTERIIVANEQGSLPYEIWQYNSLERQGNGGVILFYNPENMINDFRMLHSTINREGGNPAWRRQLYREGSNPNARAEQYLRNR